MEIERKYLIDEKNLPADLEPAAVLLIDRAISAANRSSASAVRTTTISSPTNPGGLMAREEYNLPLGAEGYAHLKEKIDGKLISKRRYLIPMENGLTIELDVFYEPCKGLLLAEVEFPDEASANSFCPPAWFGEDVTFDGRYHNSYLSR